MLKRFLNRLIFGDMNAPTSVANGMILSNYVPASRSSGYQSIYVWARDGVIWHHVVSRHGKPVSEWIKQDIPF